jgi:hypothetical protein
MTEGKPWPDHMLRYIASEDQNVLNDLIWSVGGSPPSGGISYDEAGAVYELVEQYYGHGLKTAPKSAYDKVRKFLKSDRKKLNTLDLFQCYDHIVSSQNTFSKKEVDHGLSLCKKLGHTPALMYFLSLLAEVLYRDGNIGKAKDILVDILPTYMYEASQDVVYSARAVAAVQNAISFTAMDGDFPAARQMLDKLGHLISPGAREQISLALREHS